MLLKQEKRFDKMKNWSNLPYCWVCGKQIQLDEEVCGIDGEIVVFVHKNCLPQYIPDKYYRHISIGGKFVVCGDIPDDYGNIPVKDGNGRYQLVKFWEIREQV